MEDSKKDIGFEPKDALHNSISFEFTLWEKVRILFSKRFTINFKTETENVIGKTYTTHTVMSKSIWRHWKEKLFPPKNGVLVMSSDIQDDSQRAEQP